MKTERQIEILEKLVRYLSDMSLYQGGICHALEMLVTRGITFEEQRFIKEFIFKNKPTKDNQFSIYRNNKYWIDASYWWDSISYLKPETRQIRINFLNELISTLK